MDGRNSTGCKISLLNDQPEVPASRIPQLSHSASYSSRSNSSNPSTSAPNSPVPSLSRSSSSDSGYSPLTPPSSAFESAPSKQHASASAAYSRQHHPHQQQYYLGRQPSSCYPHPKKMDDLNASLYPPLPDPTSVLTSAYPVPAAQLPVLPPPTQQQPGSTSPTSEPSRVSSVSTQSNSKPQTKKNHYPCPMAKQVGCTDFFTTSGHAARHAKKHTGKKDAFCPECNKAFTRKDNMEQHRRTHQNGRGASRSTADDAGKVKKNTKQPAKKPSLKAEPQLEAAVEQRLAEQAQIAQVQQVTQAVQAQALAQQQILAQPPTTDPATMLLPPGGPYFLNTVDSGPVPALPMAMQDLTGRPSLHRSNFLNNLDYVPSPAAMIDPETLHYSYPSPGLSNGLNTLALAADEHLKLTEKSQSSRSPSTETPTRESP